MRRFASGIIITAALLAPSVVAQAEPPDAPATVEQYAAQVNRVLGQGVTPETNAAVPLVLSIDPRRWEVPGQHGKLLEAMGLDPDDVRPLEVPDAMAALFGDEQFTGKAWTPADHRGAAFWFNKHAYELDALRDAVMREHMFVPVVLGEEHPAYDALTIHTNVYSGMRQVSHLLLMRAGLHLGQGDLDAAMRDVVAVDRLGRHAANLPWLIGRLVGNASVVQSVAGYQMLLADPAFDATHAATLRELLDQMPARRPLRDVYAFDEGGFGWWVLADYAAGKKAFDEALAGFDLFGLNPVYRAIDAAFAHGAELDTAAESQRASWANVLAALDQPTIGERIAAAEAIEARGDAARAAMPARLEAFNEQVETLRYEANRQKLANALLLDALAAYEGSLFPGSIKSEALTRSVLAMIDTAAALTRYRLDHGKYPAALADLAPRYLAAPPLDALDGQPLRYRVDEAEVVLYSIGINLTDAGGTPDLPEGGFDDIVLRLPPVTEAADE